MIRLSGAPVAVIRRLELRQFRPRAGGKSLLASRPGMPLFWRQYADHADPERSARFRGRIEIVGQTRTRLHLQVRSMTRTGSMHSDYRVSFLTGPDGRSLKIRVTARLTVPAGRTWRVTPNPSHGEVTFCTFWPHEVFCPDGSVPKRFQWCLLKPASGPPLRIPHHHLESSDKHNHPLKPGDRFAWGVEQVNPVLELLEGQSVEAGLCAYMWDAHFGLKLCRGAEPVELQGPFERSVSFQLTALPRSTAARWLATSRVRLLGAEGDWPVYHGGRHSFRRSFSHTADPTVWPWQTTIVGGPPPAVVFARDTAVGCGDHYSLRIDHSTKASSRWEATTLGPAYGEPAFTPGERLRLTAMVRTDTLFGTAWISLRWHRAGRGSVFSIHDYEQLDSFRLRRSQAGWRPLEIVTPPMQPAPDRVHLLLQFKGEGSVWFDEVELSRLPDGDPSW